MAIKDYNGYFCESDYEYALISFLEKEGWNYLPGKKFPREIKRDVINIIDLKEFIGNLKLKLSENEINRLVNSLKLFGAESDFATLHQMYKWMVDGYPFTLDNGMNMLIK